MFPLWFVSSVTVQDSEKLQEYAVRLKAWCSLQRCGKGLCITVRALCSPVAPGEGPRRATAWGYPHWVCIKDFKTLLNVTVYREVPV